MNKGIIKVDLQTIMSTIVVGTTTWLEIGEQIAEKISTELDIECEYFIKNVGGYDNIIITLPLFAEQSDISSTIIPCLIMNRYGVISSSGENSQATVYVGLYREDGYTDRVSLITGAHRTSTNIFIPASADLFLSYDTKIYVSDRTSELLKGLKFDFSFLDLNGIAGISVYFPTNSSRQEKYGYGTFFIKAKNKLTNTYHPTIFRAGLSNFGGSFESYAIAKPMFYGLDLTETTGKSVTFRFSDVISDGIILRKIQNSLYEIEDMFMLSSIGNSTINTYTTITMDEEDFKDGIIMPDGTHYYISRNAIDTQYGIGLLAIKKFD